MKKIIKPLDIIIAIVVAITALCVYYIPSDTSPETMCIYVDGKLERCVDLNISQNEIFEINSKHGYNKIAVENGVVRVTESSCYNKLEIKAGEISKVGQSLICLPNRLVVRIEGKEEYDAISY